MILQMFVVMFEVLKFEKIMIVVFVVWFDVLEVVLYWYFISKVKMYEGLIEFIEQVLFGFVNQIVVKELNGVLQVCMIVLMMFNFVVKNFGMMCVLIGEVLVGEDEWFIECVNQLFDWIEVIVK